MLLGGHDITMQAAGEVAGFDTQVPHCFGVAGARPVEVVSLLGKHAERTPTRASPPRENGNG